MEGIAKHCSGSCGNGRGVYSSNCICICYTGFFGETCKDELTSIFPSTWPPIRYTLAFGYVFCSIFWLYAIARYFADRNRINPPHLTYKTVPMITFLGFIHSWGTSLLMFIDPDGALTYPWAVSVWMAYVVTYRFTFLGAILNFWIELVHTAKSQFKQAQQLKDVNEKYDPHFTQEDITKKIAFMNKFKVPYVITIFIVTSLEITFFSLQMSYNAYYRTIAIILVIVNWLVAFGYGIAFSIYHKKLIKIMDNDMASTVSKIIDANIKVRIICVLTVLASTVFWVLGILTQLPAGLFALQVVIAVEEWAVSFTSLSIIIDFPQLAESLRTSCCKDISEIESLPQTPDKRDTPPA